MLNFIDSVRNEGGPLPYRLQGINAELNILTYVFEALLSFYVCPDVTISSQIKSIGESPGTVVHWGSTLLPLHNRRWHPERLPEYHERAGLIGPCFCNDGEDKGVHVLPAKWI